MLKKLRLKLFLTNMLLVTTVLIIAFSIIFIKSAGDLEENSIETMQYIAASDRDYFDKLLDAPEYRSYISTYILDIDMKNKTCYVEGYGMVDELDTNDSQYINGIIKEIESIKTDIGVLPEYNMRFYIDEKPMGYKIVLLDQRYEDDYLRQLLFSLVISFIVTIVFLSVVSIILASISIKPIERSLKQQQRLISDISHELKTPLTIISTNSDIVLSHEDSLVKDEKKWLGYIKDETTRMTDLISMMLYHAKSYEAQTKLSLKPLNLTNIAYETALSFESVCFENGKSFTYSLEDNVSICADEHSLRDLLLILLDNAVKYSNENGRIELNIHTKHDIAYISVFNTGIPIPKEHIPSLFERFYRVEESRTRTAGGSGLGLSIAKRIIEENEGSISVSSSEEHGTQFICSFQIHKH